MKISILLPYKENYSPDYPGAVSLFIHSNILISKYKNDITVYGSTTYKKKLSRNYINISLSNKFFESKTIEYVKKFLEIQKKRNPDIIEVHNRPVYINYFSNLDSRIVLYFHNDPLSMIGSKTVSERKALLKICSRIIFNSQWSKKQFLKNLENFYHKSEKLEVIHQSINKVNVDLKKKTKVNYFCWKIKFSQRI